MNRTAIKYIQREQKPTLNVALLFGKLGGSTECYRAPKSTPQ